MRLHYIRQVPYEGLGLIEPWAEAARMQISETRPYDGQPFPRVDALDWLVVLGGPMGACTLDEVPWLEEEARFMRRCIDAGKPVLGICLGGQLLARALGAEVRRNAHPEIGWHRIEPTAAGRDSVLTPFFAPGAQVMQWHYDTFELPAGATQLARNDACEHQAFAWGGGVLALQFHPEMTRQEVADIYEIGGTCPEGEFVQGPAEFLQPALFERLERLTAAFLERYSQRYLNGIG